MMSAASALLDFYHETPPSVRRKFRVRHYEKGDTLVFQGDRSDDFYIILEGSAIGYHDSEEGKRFTLTVFYTGDFFGENVMLENDIRVLTIEALEQTSAAVLSRPDFLLWLESDSRFSRYLLYETCRRLKDSGRNSVVSALYPLRSRVLRIIYSRINRSGTDRIRVNAESLAEELGAAPRSIQRILKELDESGIISYFRGEIQVVSGMVQT